MPDPDLVRAQLMDQVTSMLRADFPSLALGIVITVAGLAVLAAYTLRSRNRSHLLLWLGCFALLYGVRVLVKTPTSELLFPRSRNFWVLVERLIGNFILIPAVLFTEQIYGKGWRSSMRILLWFAAAYAAVATVFEFVERNGQAAPDAGTVVLIPAFPLILIGYLAGYRPPPLATVRALMIGLAIFMLTILNEHLVNSNLLPWHAQVETLGFFILICCMGYVALQQFFDNERHLLMLQDEMRAATRIQASILPRSVPQLAGAKICVRYLPMTAVAGDFYEFIQLDSQHAGIALADVAGHGVPAALVASMVKVAIDSQAASAADPPALMSGLNNIMCRQARGELITAGYLFIDLDDFQARYSAAAHPPVLVCRRGLDTVLDFRENGLILGVRPDETYQLMSFDLRPGDRILLYTDGIAEAASADDRMFSDGRLVEVLKAHITADAETFAERLLAEVREWARMDVNGQADDMTLVVIDIDCAEPVAV